MHEERVAAARIFDLTQQEWAATAGYAHAADKTSTSMNALSAQYRQELAKAYQEYNKWKDEANEDEAKMKKLAAAVCSPRRFSTSFRTTSMCGSEAR